VHVQIMVINMQVDVIVLMDSKEILVQNKVIMDGLIINQLNVMI